MTPPLRVDPIRCTGHGLCAEILPELVWLDDWGYPVIDDRLLRPELEPLARRAVAACPAVALRLQDVGAPPAPAPGQADRDRAGRRRRH